MLRTSLLLAFTGLVFVATLSAEPWPGYRGPLTNGYSFERGSPVAWSSSDGDNVVWSVELPGPGGGSSPVVWGDRVFVTATTEGGAKRHVIAYERRNGRIDWEWAIETPDAPGATATPVTDGRHVYTWHGPAAIAAYDFKGNAIWSTKLADGEHADGRPRPSPLIIDDLLINLSDSPPAPGSPGALEAVALDKRTGDIVWRRKFDRPAGSRSTASPIRIKQDGRTEVVFAVPGEIVSLNPQSGRVFWRCRGLGKVVAASPAIDAGAIVAYSSNAANATGPALMTKIPTAGASGDVTESHRKWWIADAKHTPSSPVIVGPVVYAVDANGVVRARDVATGDVIWSHELGAPVTAPLIYASNWLYAADTTGRTHIFEARRKWKSIGDGRPAKPEATDAAPSFSDGQMLLRTDDRLYCIGTRRAT